MSTRHRPNTANKAGQSLVEFALTAPILVAIVVGVIELGIIFSVYVGLANSAREAARAAAVYRYPGPAPLSSDVGAVPTIDAGRALALSAAITETLNPIIPAEALTIVPTYLAPTPVAANPYRAGDTISVTLQISHTLLWGAIGDREIALRAQSAARIEPGGSR